MTAYSEQRYADAQEAVRGALEHLPDHAGLNFNYACFATLAGDTSDDTFAHLRRAVGCARSSARTRAETTTSPQCATTRGSSTPFAELAGLDLICGTVGSRAAQSQPRPIVLQSLVISRVVVEETWRTTFSDAWRISPMPSGRRGCRQRPADWSLHCLMRETSPRSSSRRSAERSRVRGRPGVL